MSGVEYAEFPPRADLTQFINCVWTFEGDQSVADQPVVPDGRCELIVHCAQPYHESIANSPVPLRQPPILFAGQVTRPLTLRAFGPVSVVAIRFNPCGAWPFLGTRLSELTDRRVALSALLGEHASDLHSRIVAAPKALRLGIAQEFVASRIAATSAIRDFLVERCTSLIYENRFSAIDHERR